MNVQTTWKKPAAIVALLVTAASCGSSGNDSTSQSSGGSPADLCEPLSEPETVTVADFASLSLGTYPIARAFDEFEQENIEIVEERLGATQDSIALLARGEIDVAQAALSANMFSGIDQGFEVRAVASQGQMSGEDLPSGFYVRSDLLDSGEVETIADLGGRNVGMTGTTGSAASYLIGLVLESDGLTLDDIEPVTLAFQEMNTAFESGAIDAAFVGSPFNAVVEEDGNAELFGDQQAMTDQTQAALVFGPTLLEERPQVGCAFLRANIRVARDQLSGSYNDDPDVVEGFIDQSGYTEDVVLETPEYLYDQGLALNPDTFQQIQEMFIDAGVLDLDEPLPTEDVISDDMRLGAVATLDEED